MKATQKGKELKEFEVRPEEKKIENSSSEGHAITELNLHIKLCHVPNFLGLHSKEKNLEAHSREGSVIVISDA